MPKIRCPWIMCQHNSSCVPGSQGKCENKDDIELEIKNIHEIRGFEDYVPCELEDAELLVCNNMKRSKEKSAKVREIINNKESGNNE